MNIYIDIHKIIGSDEKARSYYPEVHWTIDDSDSVTKEQMESARREIQDAVEKIFKKF